MAVPGDVTRCVVNFNDRVEVGTRVHYWLGPRIGYHPPHRQFAPREGVTASIAWALGGHTAVVKIEGVAGAIALTHVEVIE